MLKRVVSFLLTIAMMVSMVPVQAFAAEAETEHIHAEETVAAEEPMEAVTTAPAVMTEETESNTSAPTEAAEDTFDAPVEAEPEVTVSTEAPMETEISGTDAAEETVPQQTEPAVYASAQVETLEVHTLPDKTWYLVGEEIDLTGLVLEGTYDDGDTQQIRPADGIELVSGSTVSAGAVTVTVSYEDQTAEFGIIVHERGCAEVLQPSSGYPESPHNYSNNFNQTYTYTVSGAQYLKLTFSSSTYTENNYDYIYIYDGSGNQLGQYCGSTLANKTIQVTGDTVKIKLKTDSSRVYYGFSLASIYASVLSADEIIHNYESVYTDPTCLEDGYTTYTCFCGESYEVQDTGSAGHDMDEGVYTNPNCTEDGYTTYTCRNCGFQRVTIDEGSAGVHTYSIAYMPATCTEDGYAVYTCVCGESYQEQDEGTALGHNLGAGMYTAPDCVADGYTTEICQRCDEQFVTVDEGSATGIHVFEDGICTSCGVHLPVVQSMPEKTMYLVGESFDLTGLELLLTDAEGNTSVVTPADGVALVSGSTASFGVVTVTVGYETLTAEFEIYVHEKSGGEVLQPSSGYPASPHNYSNNFNKTYTYTVSGAQYLKLTFSSSTKTENNYDYIYIYDGAGTQIGKYCGTTLASTTIQVTGDTVKIKLTSDSSQVYYGFSLSSIYAGMPFEASHNYEGVYTAPTCVEVGYTTYTCFCGESYVVEGDSATGVHTYGEGVYTEPTCSEDGYITAVCQNCGHQTVTADEGSATGIHGYDEGVYTEPTCTADGYTTYTCLHCGTQSVETDEDTAGHVYENGICIGCGDKQPRMVTIQTLPSVTWYQVGDEISLTGLELLVTYENGETAVVTQADGITLASGDTTEAGAHTVTVEYRGLTVHFEIVVHTQYSNSEVLQPVSGYPESPHSYSNNFSQTYTYTVSGARYLKLTFSSSTKTESYYDYIYIYNGFGTQIGEYSGTQLAGQTVQVTGDTVKINLTSDSSNTYYGFSLTSIYASVLGPVHEKTGEGIYTEPTCTENGYSTYICFCGEQFVEQVENSAGHTYEDGECTRCGDIENAYVSGDISTTAKWALLEDGTLRIWGTGSMPYSSTADIPWQSYRSSIRRVEILDGITSICFYAFRECRNLTSVTIPASVETLGYNAFEYCTSLKEVHISDLAAWCSTWFQVEYDHYPYCNPTIYAKGLILNGEPVTDLVIPDGVRTIWSHAFYNCSSLETVYIPRSVTQIFDNHTETYGPFGGCDPDLQIYCEANAPGYRWDPHWNYYDTDYDSTLNVNWGHTKSSYEFWNSDAINAASVVIPDYVTSIPDGAFSGCTNLTSVTIPNTVTSIGTNAFSGCTSLTSVTIPVSVTNLGSNAFSGCSEELTIRYGGTKAQWIQVSCSDLQAICSDGTSDSVLACGECYTDDVRWVLTNKNVLYVCGEGDMDPEEMWWEEEVPWYPYREYIGKVIIGEGVTDIGGSAFYEYPNLSEITIPSTVSEFKSFAVFMSNSLKKVHISDLEQWCRISYGEYWNAGPLESGADLYLNGTKVTNLVIPDGITHINQSFQGCGSLTSVVIPEGVTTINENAFNSCDNLASVTLPSTLTSIGKYAFAWCNLTDITLPEGLVTIGEYAFDGNELEEITFPRSVEIISTSAFAYCNNLKTITFRHGPDDSLLIGGDAFYTWESALATTIKVPNKSDIHEHITDYDWAGSGRTVSYVSHNCNNSHYEATEVITAPTCTQSGTGRVYCPACGKTITQSKTLPALGHIPVEDAAVEATCTTSGLTAGSHCERCSAVLTAQQTVAALGHSTEVIPAVAATCLSSGLTAGSKCTRCDTTLKEQETVAALGHNIVTQPAVAATCSATGLTEGQMCSRCGHVTVAQQTVAKLAHTSVKVEAMAPTCTETGMTEGYVCSVCGATISGRRVIAALGHTEVPIGERVEPTCTKTGLTEGTKCSVCEETLEIRRVLSKLPHSYNEDSECTVCGAIGLVGFGSCGTNVKWQLRTNGLLTISGSGAMTNYSSGSKAPWYNNRSRITTVVLKSGITSVGNYAFYDCDNLTSVTMADTVTAIGEYAFYDCDAITSVTSAAATYSLRSVHTGVVIPGSVTSIGRYAFAGCDSLNTVALPDSVKNLGSNAFSNCDVLTEVTLPEGLTTIPEKLFYDCDSLRSITIPEGVTNIGAEVFGDCGRLADVTIPNSVTGIGSYAFYNCDALSGIALPENITEISVGLFYDCDGLRSITIPEGVTQIGGYAFDNCSNLSAVTLPDSVTSIGSYAFRNCDALIDITIPESVTTIGEKAFYDSDALTDVTIPEGVERIGNSAFAGCDNLTTVTIPATVSEIGTGAFDGNENLTVRFEGTAEQWHELTDGRVPAECSDGSFRTGGSCGTGLTWILKGDGSLIISGTGIMTSYTSSTKAPWYAYRDSITSVQIREGVTSIGSYAFCDCSALSNVSISDSVTSIGSYAFRNCDALTEITLPENITSIPGGLFYDCNGLRTVTIPDGVTPIGAYAFENCTRLSSVTLPDSVTSIGRYAFRNCDALAEITLPQGITSISEGLFYDCDGLSAITIPDGVTGIGSYAFRNCDALTDITIPESVITIGEKAFYDSDALTNVTIPEGVERIGNAAFAGCDGLTTVTIPATVNEIGTDAFDDNGKLTINFTGTMDQWNDLTDGEYRAECSDGSYREGGTCGEDLRWILTADGTLIISGTGAMTECSANIKAPWYTDRNSITSVNIQEGVTSIGSYAFYDCNNLTNVTMPNGLLTIGSYAFYGCDMLSDAAIGKDVTTIGKYAFYGCSSLTSVSIPNGVTRIEDYTFQSCKKLEELKIGDRVTFIGYDAFNNCDSLTNVRIPDSVTTIDNDAFEQCDKLATVSFGTGVRTIDSWVFQGCSQLQWICFYGDAPVFTSDAFYNVNIVAHYPAGNNTWTTEKRKNYCGSIIWEPYATEVEIQNTDGELVNGSTIWVDLNSDAPKITLHAKSVRFNKYGNCGWSLTEDSYSGSLNRVGTIATDYAEVSLDWDGAVTVAPRGTPGQLTLTATAKDGSGASASVTFKFVSLAFEKEAIPGEDPADMNLLSGKSKQLKIYDADTGKALTNKQVTWSMDDAYAPYAKLDKNGKLTAKKVVEKVRVEVVASIIGSKGTTVTMTIDIFPAVTSVELLDGETMVNNKTISVDYNAEPLVLTANIHPLDAMEGVTWSISDKKEAFASYVIDEAAGTLTITPKANTKAGAVTIKVTSNDGSKKTATVKLQFGTYAKTVTIDKSITTLTAGDKGIQLNATMEPAVVTKSGIVWSLKNPADKNYVSLSSGGKITPKAVLAPVDVTLVATSKDGMAKDEHTIRILPKSQAQLVLKDEKGNYVTKTTQTLDVNTQESITLSAFTYGEMEMTTVEWSPLTAKGAEITVNGDGSLTIRMLSAGSINVTAKTADGRKATVAIKGVKLAQAIEISQKKTNKTEGLEVASGKSIDLQATLADAANKKVTWSITEGNAYATIASSGKFTAAKDLTSSHKVVVRATAADGSGIYDDMEIMVRPIAQGVQVYSEEGGRMLFSFRSRNWWVRSNTTLTWDLSTQENTIAMDARVYPYYGEDSTRNAMQTISWKSSAPKIAEFVEDEEGNVSLKIHKTGSVTITATAEDGSKQKVTFKLNVIRTVTELTIADQTVGSGKSLNLAKFLTINPTDATNKKLTWRITKGGEYATISSSGSFKAKKVTATKRVEVTVSSQDGGASTTFYVMITP